MHHDAAHETGTFTCPNCGAAAAGKACQACGQKRIRPDEMSLRHVAGMVVEETLDLDGKLPRTLLDLFFHPGRLTVDYLDGRRQRHIRPIPLYLMCLALYFFFNHYAPVNLSMLVSQQPADSPLLQVIDQQAGDSGQTRAQFVAARDPRYVEAHKTASMVLDLVLLGPVLFLLYRRRRPFLAQHLVMTLHLNSFGYLLGMVPLAVMSGLGGESIPVTLLFMVVFFGYIYLALRRVYGQGHGITVVKLLALVMLNLVAAIVGTASAMIYALFS